MESVTAEWLATLGVGGIIAAFMFMFYRRDMNHFTKLWQEQSKSQGEQTREIANQNRDIALQMIGIIKDNTVALTKVIMTVDSVHRRLDYQKRIGKFPHREPREPKDEEASDNT